MREPKQTCPDIDSIQDAVRGVIICLDRMEGTWDLIKDLDGVVNEMEDVRSINYDLRDWGHQNLKELEEAVRELEETKRELEEARLEVRSAYAEMIRLSHVIMETEHA
jgi:hypothetical protein